VSEFQEHVGRDTFCHEKVQCAFHRTEQFLHARPQRILCQVLGLIDIRTKGDRSVHRERGIYRALGCSTWRFWI
jgi:hypothetical protein